MISIIIPVRRLNNYVNEAIPHYLNMGYSNFECIFLPDYIKDEDINNLELELKKVKTFNDGFCEYSSNLDKRIRIIETGIVTPGKKRDLALRYSKGDVYAFIDDDAYPCKEWLNNALTILEDETIGGVGGPAITAKTENIYEMASGKVFESFMCNGVFKYRYLPTTRKDVDDIPSVNLIVKKDIFEKVGGFDCNYYPGEDTKLCMKIINEGKRLVYDPCILVYHHRRPLFVKHIKQIANYAKHRGYFAKSHFRTSLKFSYFIPSLFIICLILGIIACLLISPLWNLYIFIIGLYIVLVLCSLKSCLYEYKNIINNLKLLLISFIGVFITHVCYGVCFIKGLFVKDLDK